MLAVCVAVAAWLLAVCGMLSAPLIVWSMIRQINAIREPKKKISILWFTWTKTRKLRAEYTAAFPEGQLDRMYNLSIGTILVGSLIFGGSVAWLSWSH